jgi:Flp pilus assembly protein TadG
VPLLNQLTRALRLAFDNRAGGLSTAFALLLTIAVMFIGAAVDFSRLYTARATVISALDAAVLAGARELQLNPGNPDNALLVARDYYRSNMTSSLELKDDTVRFNFVEGNTILEAQGAASIGTTFLRVAGITEMPIISENAADMPRAQLQSGGYGGSNLEISVMLDVTGSMCDDGAGPCTSGTKLDALKVATSELINIVVMADQSKFATRAALVPFSQVVKVGPDGGGDVMMKALTNLDPVFNGWGLTCLAFTGSSSSETVDTYTCISSIAEYYDNLEIRPCVSDRHVGATDWFDPTDAPPGPDNWILANDGNRAPVGPDSSDAVMTSKLGLTSADPSENNNYHTVGSCHAMASGNEIQPLTSDKEILLGRINGLSGYSSTAGALGTAWAFYALSPNWSGIWPSTSTPAPYSQLTEIADSGAPVLRKVAVLMTDGGYNTFRGVKGMDQQLVSDRAVAVCNEMKAKGIEVFTVGFALDELPAAERAIAVDTLKRCGSDIKHFYDTITPFELKTAFREIAVGLSGLKLIR